MENYTLLPNESVLYRNNDCKILNKYEKSNAELILTNLNLVFVKKTKKMFTKEEISIETYPIEEIKIYNDVPQIKQNDTEVEIFFIDGEKTIELYSKNEGRKFINKAFELLTGKTLAARASGKVNGSIKLVDNALGVNSVGAIKSVAEKGFIGSILGGFGKKNVTQPKIETTQIGGILSATNELLKEKKDTPKLETESFDSQIEKLKKLKELFDEGIISQDEFDAKKRQVMGI